MDILPDLTPRQLRRIKAYRPKGGVWHRIAAELDELTGLPPHEVAKMKNNAVKRMAIIDEAPREWRALVNDFDPDEVSTLAGKSFTDKQVLTIMLRRYGNPHERF